MHRLLLLSALLLLASRPGRADTPRAAGPVKRLLLRLNRDQAHALHQIETAIHNDPRLEKRFEEHYAALGGKKLWQANDAWVALGIGTVVNVGGYLQPEQLIPYLLAGVAVDLGNFGWRHFTNSRARHQTLLRMISDHSVPLAVLKPHRDALGELWPQARSHNKAAQPAPAEPVAERQPGLLARWWNRAN